MELAFLEEENFFKSSFQLFIFSLFRYRVMKLVGLDPDSMDPEYNSGILYDTLI